MTPEQLRHFTQLLEDERQRLVGQISQLEKSGIGDTMSDSLGELSMYDNHPADIGDELFERSKDIALRDNAHVLLEEVEDALDRVIDGTYGVCSRCGKTIPSARLEAVPWASECMVCQRDDEQHALPSRPLEEESLTPPFVRSFKDNDPDEFVGFDGEDAWQAVERFGSSDTPSDLPGTFDYDMLFFNADTESEGIVDPTDAIPWEPDAHVAYEDRDKKKDDE